MRNNIVSIILALCAFFVIALVCHDKFYQTGKYGYQAAIALALIAVIVYGSMKIKQIADDEHG